MEKKICEDCKNRKFNKYGCQNEISIAGSSEECGSYRHKFDYLIDPYGDNE